MSLEFLQGAEFAEPTEVSIKKTLSRDPPPGTGGMQLGAINKITQARIRWAVAELTALNLEKVSRLVDELGKDSPKAALDFLLELLKFTTPQQKSMTVESTPADSTNYGNLTVKQLQGLVFSQVPDSGVVSEQ